MTNADSGVLQDQYSYDANDNIAAIVDQQEGVTNRSMAYDGLNRLTGVYAPSVWGSAGYAYDALDNLRVSTVGARSSVHSYDANNRLSTINTNSVFTGYVYDGQGNITGRGTQGFYFDQGNRMTLANGVASYSYDGHGRRTGINGADGSTRTQVYDQGGQLLYATRQAGANVGSTRYVYLGGKAIAQTDSNSAIGTNFLVTDALGSPVATVGNVPAGVSYSCPSGWNLAGNTCSQATTSTIAATVSGYTCQSGYTQSGSNCSQTASTTSAASVSYSCPAGWSLSGNTCSSSTSSPASPVYACPSGYTLSGSNCNRTTTAAATATSSCNGHGALTNSTISSTGTYCLLQNYSYKVFSDPEQNCAALALSFGLVMDPNSSSNGIQTYRCILAPKITYSCPSGGTLSGTSCLTSASVAATVGGYTCSSGILSGSSCITTTAGAASASYSCPSGQSLSGTTCTATSTTTVAGTPIYSCPSGYTLSGSSCTAQGTATTAATANFTCASGTLSGANCQNAVTRTRYEPYGNTAAGSVPRELGFTGHVNDAETGLVQMQQRYYDPVAGRFLSLDPVTTDASTGGLFNRYVYGNNNPYRYTDPDGRLSTGEWIDRWAQDAADRGSRASTFGWAFAGVAWRAFGAEGISQIADKGAVASTGDRVSAGIELIGVLPGGKLLGEAATAAKGMSRAEAVIAETLAGKGNLTSATKLSSNELLQAGEKFLGSGYKEIGKPGSGVFRSADGTRQFRIDGNSLSGNHAPGVPHGHLETYAPGAAKPTTNNHIPFFD